MGHKIPAPLLLAREFFCLSLPAPEPVMKIVVSRADVVYEEQFCVPRVDFCVGLSAFFVV
jgi:hypothetical protein